MTLSPLLRQIIGGGLLLLIAIGAIVSLTDTPEPVAQASATLSPTVDHFVLALGWSPSYCAEAGEAADRAQCGAGKTYGFILRGLWPQTASGPMSECSDDQSRVPPSVIDDITAIMPSPRLAGAQWRKHGTCTGLPPEDYFDLARRAFERVTIPEPYRQPTEERRISPREIERDFLAANPDLKADMIGVTCTDNYVREVRICLTPGLGFRVCNAARNECRLGQVTMPAPPK